ncbi:MAG: DNA adenine methylase [Meiothermus sp.]|nr:DNA adenine methylase [Meiothermus sp.]
MVEAHRPLLRYHGGKWRIAPWVIAHFPQHRIYVEPFGGAASVLLRKPRSYAEVYNDLDGEIVNLFRVVREQGEELCRLVALTPYARDEFELSYEPADDPLEQARRTLLRSWAGFGTSFHKRTGFRSNSERNGSHPAMDWRNFPPALAAIVERLRGVVIENRDALEVIAQYDGPQTLHYCDPPYLPETRDPGTDYRHEMTREDHVRLAEALHAVEGYVVLSGYHSALYDELYAGWPRVERATLADGARPRVEVLWISPRTWEVLTADILPGLEVQGFLRGTK